MAAKLGLPFAFASHFSPDFIGQAISLYRQEFQPSRRLAKPCIMMVVNVIAAESRAKARYLFTSQQQQFIHLRRGMPRPLPAPVENMDHIWNPAERFGVERALSLSLVGDLATVLHGMEVLQQQYQVDEMMVNGQIHDNEARIFSFQLAMEACRAICG